MSTPRIINGCWQLSSGHSSRHYTDELLMEYVKSGLTTFDCADIYTGVEERLGQFKQLAEKQGYALRIQTKLVPDLAYLEKVNEHYITTIIKKSCCRLQLSTLPLVQFHWWDYSRGDYIAALNILQTLKEKGLIEKIGLTNFNTYHLQRILSISAVKIDSVQMQYSLLDRRPDQSLMALLKKHSIESIGYGSLAGGFFSAKWLSRSSPSFSSLKSRSLTKYRLIIDEFGGWEKYQCLLRVIAHLAKKYHLSIADFVVLYLLKYTAIDKIVLGVTIHFNGNPLDKLDGFSLTEADRDLIHRHSKSIIPGDVYDLERDPTRCHAKIMHYNLNDSHDAN